MCEEDTVASINGELEEWLELSESPSSHKRCSRSDSVIDVSVEDMKKNVAN